MAESPAVPEKMTLSVELLHVLTSGDAARLVEFLRSDGQTNGHIAINVAVAAPPGPGTSSCLLGVTSNGNTALHLVTSRGHAELAALICEKAPSLVATRNRALDTPLHCAARGGHLEVAACLLSAILNSSGVQEAAALQATNRLGDTALHEAIRHGHAEMVDLIMEKDPDLASVTSEDGVSPLYLAATTGSVQMVRLLLRPLPDGTPSPASSAGRKGRTALHVAATISKEMVQAILAWEPEGPALLTRVDSSGRSPLHFAIRLAKLDVVKLFLEVNSNQLVRISDKDGYYPVHYAAARGNVSMIDELIKRCPEYYELVDDYGRNLLHVAVINNNIMIVQYVCRNERFAMLLNSTDFKGNTPLHLAVKCANPRISCALLQTTAVEVNINNRDGLTARDLAYDAYPLGRLQYFYYLEPAVILYDCLCWAVASSSLDYVTDIVHKKNKSAKENSAGNDYTTQGTIASVLIATVTFAAAFTVPGGIIADDHHPNPGTAILARRVAFKAFVLSDIAAFIYSIMTTIGLIYSSVSEIPQHLRTHYSTMAFESLPVATQFMIATFGFGLHIVLGVTNSLYKILVHITCLVSVLAIVSSSKHNRLPLHVYGLAKAMWLRGGWKGFLNIHKRTSGFHELLWHLFQSPLGMCCRGVFLVVHTMLVCPTLIALVMALEFASPNS